MKRSYIAISVLGLALGGLWYSTGGYRPSAELAANTLRVSEPVVHENLAVFLVRGPDEVDSTRMVTLQEALERNWAVVHETGNVNTLVVENLSPDHDLFVQSGDMIKGGRQDRMIASDMLLPPTSGKVPVGVHCVEHNRWTGRGTEAASHFAISDNYAVGNEIKIANASGNQHAVWEGVANKQTELTKSSGVQVNAEASPTSLQLALENPAVLAKVQEYRRALRSAGGRRGVVGAVFVVNGKVSSAELYGSNLLFQKAWPKLLKAASIEALAEKATVGNTRPPAVQEVEDFLAMGGKADQMPALAGQTRLVNNGEETIVLRVNETQTRQFMIRGDFNTNADIAANPEIVQTEGSTDHIGVIQTEGNAFSGNRVVQTDPMASPERRAAQVTSTTPQVVTRAGTNEQRRAEVQQLVRQYNELVAQSNFAEAGRVALQATRLEPDNPAIAGLAHVARMRKRQQDVESRRNTREEPVLQGLNPVSAIPAPAVPPPSQAMNPGGNQLHTNQLDNGSTLLLESRDAGKKVIHRSYIKK